jgi:hypothetical protein
METKDIEKADPSSLKKGITTIRQTNPLMPNYKFPGHSEVGNNAGNTALTQNSWK